MNQQLLATLSHTLNCIYSQHASPNIHVVIVGHKCDAEDERAVTTAEGQRVHLYLV